MRPVSVDGTFIKKSANSANLPPVAPVMATTATPISRAFSAARITFGELPEVLMATSVSPFRAEASSARAKTVS